MALPLPLNIEIFGDFTAVKNTISTSLKLIDWFVDFIWFEVEWIYYFASIMHHTGMCTQY